MVDLTAPSEGEASSADEIADALCDALVAFDHVDYNALTVDELRELLDARETVGDLCLRYRRRAQNFAPGASGDEADQEDAVDLATVTGDASAEDTES